MNVSIYYGGRGLLDDPTLYVLNKMEEVLRELRVNVERINIYEHKNEIATLPQTMKEADGIILATTVEWLGIGGYMQQFLDACWLYGDKEKIKTTYMQPVVMSTTYGEREGELTLANAWEILGGLPCPGICGYVDDLVSFEMNKDYTMLIEKKAENLYRTISQKMKSLPTSNQAVKQSILRTPQMELTPQESEQLSKYVSDDTFVKTQKKDIESLASIYKELLSDEEHGGDDYYINVFKNSFRPGTAFSCTYMIIVSDKNKTILINVNNDILDVEFGENNNADVIAKLNKAVFDDIVAGKITFHRAFMTGDMTAKGNFRSLRMLDSLFEFAE